MHGWEQWKLNFRMHGMLLYRYPLSNEVGSGRVHPWGLYLIANTHSKCRALVLWFWHAMQVDDNACAGRSLWGLLLLRLKYACLHNRCGTALEFVPSVTDEHLCCPRRIAALEFVPLAEEAVNKRAIELEEKEALDRAERRMLALLSLENSIASKEKAVEHKKKLGDKALQEVTSGCFFHSTYSLYSLFQKAFLWCWHNEW